jgi:hypothetical protein
VPCPRRYSVEGMRTTHRTAKNRWQADSGSVLLSAQGGILSRFLPAADFVLAQKQSSKYSHASARLTPASPARALFENESFVASRCSQRQPACAGSARTNNDYSAFQILQSALTQTPPKNLSPSDETCPLRENPRFVRLEGKETKKDIQPIQPK